MSRRIVEFVAEFRRVVHVEIDVPEGASRDAIGALIDPIDSALRAEFIAKYPDLDRRISRTLTDSPPPPPEWAWVTVGDRRWATDGASMVTEGAPSALAADGPWRRAGEVEGRMLQFLARVYTTRTRAPESTSFRRRFAPLFEHADDMWWSEVAPGVVPAALARGGLVFAVVMPTEAGPGEDGRDFRPFERLPGSSERIECIKRLRALGGVNPENGAHYRGLYEALEALRANGWDVDAADRAMGGAP